MPQVFENEKSDDEIAAPLTIAGENVIDKLMVVEESYTYVDGVSVTLTAAKYVILAFTPVVVTCMLPPLLAIVIGASALNEIVQSAVSPFAPRLRGIRTTVESSFTEYALGWQEEANAKLPMLIVDVSIGSGKVTVAVADALPV